MVLRALLTISLSIVAVLPAAAAAPSNGLGCPNGPPAPAAADTRTPLERESRRTAAASTDRPYWRRNLFKRLATDQAHLFRTWLPAELRRPAFIVPFGVSLTAAVTSSSIEDNFDQEAQQEIAEFSAGQQAVAESLSTLGDVSTAAVLLGSTYLISRWAGNTRLQRATSLSAEALINAGIYSTLIKKLARRNRPSDAGNGQFFVQGASFPSGHATGAFAVATVFAAEYRDRKWVAWAAYGGAGLIALSRVALSRHYLTDVIAGALLGNSFGRMVAERNYGERGRPRWSELRPYYDEQQRGYGVAFSHSW